ncbi:MAG: TMEM165/GDT1 family protein [Deltaproteobacteria bacterium]|nr:TMEM165/GDT1 family protein [Deltaproteobacteria bacterium]MBW2067965.1 TMEM165/GDT1 family protein [Deltaproteobacteria bacterium]
MDWKVFVSTFLAIFLAELGDKTQLATFSFAVSSKSRWTVFIAASLALTATSGLGVFSADLVQNWVSPYYLKLFSGALFVTIGICMLVATLKSAS